MAPPGVAVHAGEDSVGGVSKSLVTGREGRFELALSVTQPRDDEVRWVWATHEGLVSSRLLLRPAAPDEAGTFLVLRLAETGTVRGVAVDEAGVPVPGARIGLVQFPDSRSLPSIDWGDYSISVAWAAADEAGTFAIRSRGGPKELVAARVGGMPGAAVPFTLDEGRTVDLGRVEVGGPEVFRIDLSCSLADGRPAAGARVVLQGAGVRAALLDRDGWHFGTTDGSGVWRSPPLPRSLLPLSLRVGSQTMREASARILESQVEADGHVPCSLVLDARPHCTLRIRWPQEPPSGLPCTVLVSRMDMTRPPWKEPTQDSFTAHVADPLVESIMLAKEYRLWVPEPGAYAIHVSIPGVALASRRAEFAATSAAQEITLDVAEGRWVQLELDTASRASAAIGPMRVYDASSLRHPLLEWEDPRSPSLAWLARDVRRLRIERGASLRGPWEPIFVDVPSASGSVEVWIGPSQLEPPTAGVLQVLVEVAGRAQGGVPFSVQASENARRQVFGAARSADTAREFRLPAGRYRLGVQLSGMAPAVQEVEILQGQTARAVIRLP